MQSGDRFYNQSPKNMAKIDKKDRIVEESGDDLDPFNLVSNDSVFVL